MRRKAPLRSQSSSSSSTESRIAEHATSRSSSSSRPTAVSSAAPAFSKDESRTRRAATKASATTRSSFRRTRSGLWRNWGTSGRRSTLIVLGLLARFCELSVTLPPPPVDLAAEHNHVRHHIEPEEEDRRAAERAERHVDVGQPDEDRQSLERRLEHDRAHDGAGECLPPRDARVRQPAVDGEQETEDADERSADRDDVREDRAVRESPEVVLQHAHAECADNEAREQRDEDTRRERRRQQLPA